MKNCSRCGVSKPLEEFAPNPRMAEGRASQCRDCTRAYQRDRYANNEEFRKRCLERARIRRHADLKRDLKDGKPCTDCRKPWPWYILQWDHLDPSTKTPGGVAGMQGGTPEDVLDETAKCELVCANCHAERTLWRRVNGQS